MSSASLPSGAEPKAPWRATEGDAGATPTGAPELSKSRFLGHFFLVEEPFSLSPDPEYLYLSDTHTEALAALDVGISDRRGLIVLVGEVGTGKTTLARYISETQGSEARVAVVTNTMLSFEELLRTVLRSFGREVPANGSRGELVQALRSYAEERDREGGTVAILIDEAQTLDVSLLEDLRQLLNIESTRHKLLQVVLVGQPELQDRLEKRQLRHVADRVAVRCHLDSLGRDESIALIAYRVQQAGGTVDLFSHEALQAIVKAAKGSPRALCVLCHNSMLFACGRRLDRVDLESAHNAIRGHRGEGMGLLRSWRARAWALASAAIAGAAIAGAAMFWLLGGGDATTRGADAPSTEQATVEVSAESQDAVEEGSAPEPEAIEADDLLPTEIEGADLVMMPNGTLLVRVAQGSTLHDLMVGIYGEYSPDQLEVVLEANPQIRNPDRLYIGQVVRFPSYREERREP